MNPKTIGNYDDIALESSKDEETDTDENVSNNSSAENAEKYENEAQDSREGESDDEIENLPKEKEKEESRFLFQEFLMDPDTKVYEILTENNMKVMDFVRFEVGEELPEESETDDKVSASS